MIYQYAVVDEDTNQVVGKKVTCTQPKTMRNIDYTLTLPDGTEVTGKAFLSKAVRFWDMVKDPLYLVQPGIEEIELKLEGVY